jgi:hypothetical protein
MKLSTILGSLGGESKFSKGDLDRIQQHSSQELLEMLPKEGSLKVAYKSRSYSTSPGEVLNAKDQLYGIISRKNREVTLADLVLESKLPSPLVVDAIEALVLERKAVRSSLSTSDGSIIHMVLPA